MMPSQSSKSTAIMATAGSSDPPSLLQQVAMAGGAAVITVTFIHPIDVVKVSYPPCLFIAISKDHLDAVF